MLQLLNSFAVSFDLPILNWIQANLQCGFLDFIMPIITLFGDGGIFWIGCAVILLFFPKYRKVGLTMGLALVMGVVVCNITLKPIVGRLRPCDFIEKMGLLESCTLPAKIPVMHDFSFPSGHTIASFEAAVVLLLNDKKLGIPAFILAILISLSRLYLYVHYPTDVIFSVIFGTLFAILANMIMKKVKFGEPRHGKYEKVA